MTRQAGIIQATHDGPEGQSAVDVEIPEGAEVAIQTPGLRVVVRTAAAAPTGTGPTRVARRMLLRRLARVRPVMMHGDRCAV